MKKVGVREFRDHATQYLGGDEILAVERHGEPIGFYVPTGRGARVSFDEALARLEQMVSRVLAETGMSEDELVSLYDLKQRMPDLANRETPSEAHASGR